MLNSEADKLHGELTATNRALLRAMRRRDRLAKQLAQQETLCDQLSQGIKQLIAFMVPRRPPAVPICSDCQHVLGSNPACPFCQETRARDAGEPSAHQENP